MNLARAILVVVCVAGARLGAQGEPFDLHRAIAGAPDGGVVVVPPGRYMGPVVIDHPVVVEGRGAVVIDGGGEGDVLTVRAPDVTIRGVTLRNTGVSLDRENAGITVTAARVTIEGCRFEEVLFGIYLKESPDSTIRGNHVESKSLDLPRRGDGIRLWESPRGLVEDNVVEGSRDVVMWFSDGVVLRRNVIRHGRYGLHFMYSDSNTLEENRLEHNSVGAFLMYSHNLTLRRNTFAYNRGPSGFGLGLKDMDGLVAEDNRFIGNRVGIEMDNSPSRIDIVHHYRHNVIAYNDIGIAFMPSVTRNEFSENSFLDNVEQVAVLGQGLFEGNSFTVGGVGNYWSDYRGYDLDGDGFGDSTYKEEGLFENLMDREPKLRLFLFSPAQRAVEMAARAFPIVAPRPKLADSAPLMSPVATSLPPEEASGNGRLWLGAAGLLALGAVCVGGGVRPWVVVGVVDAERGAVA